MKKFIALLISVLLIATCAVPAFAAADAEPDSATLAEEETTKTSKPSFDIDLSDILNSSIVQGIIGSDGFADLTAMVIEIMAKFNKEELEQMGKEKVQEMVQNVFNTLVDAIKLVDKNKDLIITYDPQDVLDNLFGIDIGSLTTKAPDTTNPDDMVIGPGDVDGDGKITAADARLILRRAAKLISFTMEQDARADVDKDGKVTAADARKVLRVSAGLETL